MLRPSSRSEPAVRVGGAPRPGPLPGGGSGGAGAEGISLFFPAYNEQENVAYMVGRAVEVLAGLGVPFEVIVVDDGSRDATASITRDLAASDDRIRLVSHGRNLGFGMAVRSGIEAARHSWIFYTDCDGQFDLDDLKKLWDVRGESDVISAFRRRRMDPGLRLFYTLCYNSLAWILFWGGFMDVDCSFKLYRRSIFDVVRPRSTCGVIDLEILHLARGHGFRVRQLPVAHRPRRAGTVSFETVRWGFFAWVRLSAVRQMFAQLWDLRVRTWRGDVS